MSSIEKAMQRKAAAKPKVEKNPELEEQQKSELSEEAAQPEVQQADVVEKPAEEISGLGAGISEQEAELVKTQQDAESGSASGSDKQEASQSAGSDEGELVIDLEQLENNGFVTLRNKRTLINEEYRSIKRKLLNNAFGAISKTIKHSNLILVSSSKPNEGKTFTAVNLALSIALEQDKTVLLVDSDVLKPSVSKTLNIGNNVGLIEYLLGEEEDVASIIYRTNIERLRVIPAGLPHHLSNELLSSDKMMRLISEFATRYPDRIVVFDAPPLLGVNETAVMAEQCGQGVVVVEEHKSKIADVQKAVDLLPEEMAVGFVMNKVTSENETQNYGYYYGSKSDELEKE